MEHAKSVIDQLDVDKDGKVSYPEFILVMKYKKLQITILKNIKKKFL